MKTGLTIGLGILGAAAGYGFSFIQWDSASRAGLAFTVCFVLAMLGLIGYNASVSKGADKFSEKVFTTSQYFIAALLTGLMSAILALA